LKGKVAFVSHYFAIKKMKTILLNV